MERFIDNLPTRLKRSIMFGLDVFIIICSYFLASFFKYLDVNFLDMSMLKTCLFATIIYSLVFHSCRLYRSVIRYSSVRDYGIIGLASIASSFIVMAIDKFYKLQLCAQQRVSNLASGNLV